MCSQFRIIEEKQNIFFQNFWYLLLLFYLSSHNQDAFQKHWWEIQDLNVGPLF